MERVLSQEERIRRAEQIVELRRNARDTYRNDNFYARRKENGEIENSQKKNFVIRSMIKQICICLIIYTIFFVIKNQNFIFSEQFISKTKEILSYDVNFMEVYNNGVTFLQEKYNSEYEEREKTKNGEEENKETTKNEEEKTENKDEKENVKSEDKNGEKKDNEEKKETSQAEKDLKYIKDKYSLVKPVSGTISSNFGHREDTNPIVTEEHKGIDIATNKGTKIVSAMDGVVDIATTSSSYGKYIQITNGEVKTIYAHCNKLYVKEGDKIKSGQKIAEVGDTGEATRSTFAF